MDRCRKKSQVPKVMDLFKLLTRSSKRFNNSDHSRNPVAPIPSSGQHANPQLFGDDTDTKSNSFVLGKRKRNSNDATTNEDKDLLEADKTIKGDPPSLEECKKALKSHKIKVSILSNPRKKTKVRDSKPPAVFVQPLSFFSDLTSKYGLGHKISQNLESQDYSKTTEIQLAALPILLGESLIIEKPTGLEIIQPAAAATTTTIDLLAVAPTGSGKSLAFLIPIINNLFSNQSKLAENLHAPRAVVIAPTRELASQIVNEARKLALNTGLKVTLIKKGMRVGSETELMPFQHHVDDAKSSNLDDSNEENPQPKSATTFVKSDIIVTTPLSLIHALQATTNCKQLSTLPSVQHLVLDEADVLLDPLFQSQTLNIWKACTNPSLRSSLWSATMPSTIETLATQTITSYSPNSIILRLIVGLKDSALPTLTHRLVYAATEQGKLLALRQLLRPSNSNLSSSLADQKELRPPFLVFTQTIPRATALHAELRYDIPPEAGGSSRIAVLHAGLSESARARVMAAVRRGDIWVVVTTDLLARGVDFRGLNAVVNYDVPTSTAAYIHRAGRTGRGGRVGGVVVTLYTKEDIPIIRPIVGLVSASERAAGKMPEDELHKLDWLLKALPTPSKNARKELKQRGVEVRRANTKGKKAIISTKLPDKRKRGYQTTKSSTCTNEEAETEFQGFD